MLVVRPSSFPSKPARAILTMGQRTNDGRCQTFDFGPVASVLQWRRQKQHEAGHAERTVSQSVSTL